MPVRSHYSRDSFMNRPLHARGARRRGSETEHEDDAPCEACKNCEYKQLVESVLAEEENEREPVGYKIQNPKARALLQTQQNQKPIKEQEDKKPAGLLKKFGNYIAKNQAANKAAGDTSLMDDLQKWGGGIMKGAGQLGQEEIDGLERKKAASGKRDPRADDDLVNFVMGKKTRK